MRKVCLLVMLIGCNQLHAQTFGFGAKGGATFHRFANGFTGNITTVSPHIGTATYFGINKRLGVELDIMYYRRLARFRIETLDLRARFHYLSVPVMLRYKHPSGFFAGIGPQINLLTSQTFEDENLPYDNPETEYNIHLTAGYRHPTGVGLEFRYLRDMTTQLAKLDNGHTIGFYPNVFQVSLLFLLLFDD